MASKAHKRRIVLYTRLVRWTAAPLFVLMWLMLITGPATFKGDLVRRLTLGLVDPANAGKLHSVWLPSVTGVLFYIHTMLGFQLLGYRLKWIQRKAVWEVVIFALGLGGIVQFLWLYYGS